MRRALVCLLTVCMLAPVSTTAQNSIFGVHGIGFPGRPVSARARALGGGTAPFDARSALNPASVAALGPLVVMASSGTSLRGYTALDSVAEGLSETRFPFALIGTRVRGLPLSIALSYSSYAERSYDQLTSDSVTIRGESMAVADQVSSSGGIADVRGAVAWRVTRRLSVGGAVHVLSGSVQAGSRRFFSNSRYRPYSETSRISYSGFGISAGALVTPFEELSVGASIRSDTELKSKLKSDAVVGTTELPLSYSGGVFFTPHPSIRWSTSAEWHAWSSAARDIEAVDGARAFDTWAIGSGLELGTVGGTPLRVGARYAQLPFGPSADQPSELALSAGTVLGIARGRASLDFSVERLMRDGAGAEERAWYLMFALTVMP